MTRNFCVLVFELPRCRLRVEDFGNNDPYSQYLDPIYNRTLEHIPISVLDDKLISEGITELDPVGLSELDPQLITTLDPIPIST